MSVMQLIAPAIGDVVDAPTFALALVEHFEGFRSRPYQDGGGVWTIGYGTTRINGYRVLQTTPAITVAQALQYLLDDMQSTIDSVAHLVSVEQSVCQTAALISLVYNIGIGHFTASTLRRLINAQDKNAAQHFLDWDMINHVESTGLLARRKMEYAVYTGKLDYPTFIHLFPIAA
jgi:lysozyme